jgi:hypothetical protein
MIRAFGNVHQSSDLDVAGPGAPVYPTGSE